jgi:hypothetical protein
MNSISWISSNVNHDFFPLTLGRKNVIPVTRAPTTPQTIRIIQPSFLRSQPLVRTAIP